MYKAKIDVTLKESVSDPQGQTVLQSLRSLGFQNIESLRVGKHFEMVLNANGQEKAESDIKAMCGQLLVNPVIEQYTVRVEQV
ncbi:MAG: phosphoribosylformylglycinamidine synthase [Omnitrophica bacterium RIFCSPLOWO2_12_FULL_50_11]|nr:MAG: phosphoribosylformylglycinamidine synthase [Omnitrophica bacterium RIFCSPLOWO2_12_FULL_50_11]